MQYQIWVPSRFTIVYNSFSKCEQSSQYITIHCNWILIWAKLLQKEATEVTLWIPWLARRQILPRNVPKAHVACLLTGPNFLQMFVAGELYVKSYGDLLVLLLAATCCYLSSKYFLFWCLDASRCDMQCLRYRSSGRPVDLKSLQTSAKSSGSWPWHRPVQRFNRSQKPNSSNWLSTNRIWS